MKDIAGILSEYCEEQDIFFLSDTQYGQNQAFDKFKYAEQDYGMWINILETGSYDLANSVASRVLTHTRTVAVSIVQKCRKEDKGANYYNQLTGLLNQQELLLNHLIKELDVTSATYESAVDADDVNLVATTLTITFNDNLTVC